MLFRNDHRNDRNQRVHEKPCRITPPALTPLRAPGSRSKAQGWGRQDVGRIGIRAGRRHRRPGWQAASEGEAQAAGGGWFYSDGEGTLSPDGKANFGFTARYKNDESTGKLDFQYEDAVDDIHLKSTRIDWLAISAVSAQLGHRHNQRRGLVHLPGEG